MTDGLKDKHRNGILGVLEQFPEVERALLFGSRATGNFRAASDIDLALEGPLHLQDLARILSKISDLNLPIEVQLVARSRITDPAFADSIRREGIEWYKRRADSLAARE